MCDCQSYNRPEDTGSVVAVVRDPRPYIPGTTRTVAIDACIADDIEGLWVAGIETRHSCCGHNGLFGGPSVGVERVEDVPRAAALLRDDGRSWRIFVDVKSN